jgi:hypothetical protein
MKIGGVIVFGYKLVKDNSSTIDISNLSSIKAQDLRKGINILIVDDEDFIYNKSLQDRGFNICKIDDIKYTIQIQPFDIVIIDINDVAKEFSVKQGLGFAIEAKKIYPHKYMVACSGKVLDPELAQSLAYIDNFIPKDTDIDRWVELLDEIIKQYLSVEYHWSVIEKRIRDSDFPKQHIPKIKELYFKSYKTGTFDELASYLYSVNKNMKLALEIITSIVSLFKLLMG